MLGEMVDEGVKSIGFGQLHTGVSGIFRRYIVFARSEGPDGFEVAEGLIDIDFGMLDKLRIRFIRFDDNQGIQQSRVGRGIRVLDRFSIVG
jgi:hypothetical protein